MIEPREVIAERQSEFARLMREYPHEGDPCIHCNVPHDEVTAGPCVRHIVNKNDGSIDDAMNSFAAKEVIVRDALSRIDAGVEYIFSMMTPAQRAMIYDGVGKIFTGMDMIEGVLQGTTNRK